MRLAAALLLLPLSTFAQSPTQPPEASRAAPAQWSLGAGWSPGYASVITTSAYTPWVSAILALPAVTASLERRLGERTWLALGVSARWTAGTTKSLPTPSARLPTTSARSS